MNIGLSRVKVDILKYLSFHSDSKSRRTRAEVINNVGLNANRTLYYLVKGGEITSHEELIYKKKQIVYTITDCGYHYLQWRLKRNE